MINLVQHFLVTSQALIKMQELVKVMAIQIKKLVLFICRWKLVNFH